MSIIKDIRTLVQESLYTDNHGSALAPSSTYQTRQNRFVAFQDDLIHPSLYPWVFIHNSGVDPEIISNLPLVFRYTYVLSIVVLDFNSRDPEALDTLENILTIRDGLLSLWKRSQFGYGGSSGTFVDWDIGQIGTPNVPSIQLIILNQFIEATQMDLIITIQEDRNAAL